VWPRAQNIFDGRRAQEQKAANDYARQAELTRRRPPACNTPVSGALEFIVMGDPLEDGLFEYLELDRL